MAQRRMFNMKIIDSDAFLDMPLTTQALYFHLSMRADDDGFVNSPKRIQRLIGATDDDMRVLITKRFILTFESGVIVIKHWKIHNYIQNDRYNRTQYTEELESLEIKDNGAYTDTKCIQNGYKSDTQVRLGKVSKEKDPILRIGKKEKENTLKIPPTVDEVRAYCNERGNNIDPEFYIDYYQARDWIMSNGRKMKDWKASIRTWERKDKQHDSLRANGKGNAGVKKTTAKVKDYDKW